MNRHSAAASALALALALGLSAIHAAVAQEADGEGERRDARDEFQRPREDGPRFDRRAPAPPPAAFPPSTTSQGPDAGGAPSQAWGRFGQPRDLPSGPGADPGRGGADAHRPDVYRPDAYRPDGYRPDDYRPDGYRPDGYRPDGYRPDGYRPDGYHPDRDRPWTSGGGYGGGYANGYRPPAGPGGRPPHYDPRRYPPVWTPPYRYRADRWVPPPGFSPRRWSYGEVLPWTWWTPRYRIETWWLYGLPVPPLGYAWVRLGRDAALVDLWTGRIVQVAFFLFW